MSIDIAPVRGRREMDAFLELPWQIYKGLPAWVPPLLDQQRAVLSRDHPFHRQAGVELFLARMRGQAVGRVAAIENSEHNRVHGERAGFFGFFECVDDIEVSEALLDAARDWLRARGLECMRGPVNPSTNDECGLLIEGFQQRPVFMMPYNPPYYAALLEKCGLGKVKDLNSYYVDRQGHSLERAGKMRRLAERVKARPDVVIRPPNMKRFPEEVAAIKEVYRDAWEHNWGFVPMTDAEFDHLAVQLKELIVPDFARLVTVNGRPAAFAIIFPNYNEAIAHTNGRFWPFGLPVILAYYYFRWIRGARLLALGVGQQYRKRGLEALMMHELYEQFMKSHYQWFELGWTLEDNRLINNAIEAWGGRLYKRYRIYEAPL